MYSSLFRKRTLHPDTIFDAPTIHLLGERGFIFYQNLWMIAEDWGGYEYNPHIITAFTGAWAFTLGEVEDYIKKLIDSKKIISYKIDGIEYHWIKSLLDRNENKYSPANKIPLPKWIEHKEKNYPTGIKYMYQVDLEKLPKGVTFKKGRKPQGEKTEVKKTYGEHGNVYITEENMEKLHKKYGEEFVQKKLEDLSDWKANKGVKGKNDYARLNTFCRKDFDEKKEILAGKKSCTVCDSRKYTSMIDGVCNKCKKIIDKETAKDG